MGLFDHGFGYPPYLKRRRRRFLPYAIILGLLYAIAMVLSLLNHPFGFYELERVAAVGIPLIFWPLVIYMFLDKRRVKAQIKASDYFVCPQCWYALQGLDKSGRCPECGTPYEEEALRRIWRRSEDEYF